MKKLTCEDTDTNKHLSHDDFTIAWISALPAELAAAEGMLDERYPNLPTPPNDENTYVFGRMHIHNIVIACLPAGVPGTNSAATIASQIRSTFPSLRFGLMVGIGGGVPSAEHDIRLGDVVVSQPTGQLGGVIQYDYGKAIHDGQFERKGMLNKPPLVLLTAVTRMRAAHILEPSRISELIFGMVKKWPAMKDEFTYPTNTQDLLFDCKYEHEKSQDTCANCDASRQVKRAARVSHNPAIHYGLIGSANQVMKDGLKRDDLAQQLGILCFEMEAAGLMDNFPCLVIRGISDYADSHKNKQWQSYAAATAAGYAKELLSVIHEKQLVDAPNASMTDVYYRRKASVGTNSATSGAIEKIRYQDYERLFPRISSNDHEKIHRRLSHKRFENTTQWFLNHPDFKAWFTEKSISNLWCSGKIGSGKTMIATAVIDAAKYRNSELPTATVFFYCQNEQFESLQVSVILSSFIKQLCEFLQRTSSSFPGAFLEALQKFFGNDRTVPDFEDLKDLFMQIFYYVPDTVYVVDGIDALDSNNSKCLLKLIQSIFRGLKSPEGSRMLLFSRDYIEGYINISTFIPGIRHISTSTNITGDIKKFIEMSIIDKTMHRNLTNDRILLEELESNLLMESAGMFLWVYLQLEIIWSTCFTDAEIRIALRQLPKDLEETFQYCLRRINLHDKRPVRVLKWVSFAARPLHIEELKEAVAFDISDTAWDPAKVPQQDFIIGCCANLVVLDPTDYCVRFAHSSVKQFLSKLRGEFAPTYPISEDKGELECGEFSVAYLSFSNFSSFLEKNGHEKTKAMVPQPAFMAGEVMGPALRHFLRITKRGNGTTALSFPRMRTLSTPERNQFQFLDYAIRYWVPQTKHIKQSSRLWVKFEQLAKYQSETWNFHPWVNPGLSKTSRLHGLFGLAVKERHEPLLSIALNQGKYIRQICDLPLAEEGLPALHFASKLGYCNIIKSLLGICNINALDVEDYTALHHAADKGHTDIVRLLLSTKTAIVDCVSRSKITPLWLASSNGHSNAVSLLIENKANIEISDLEGQTPLWKAAENGNYSVVELLIKGGANLEAKNDLRGLTPLGRAAEKGHYSVVKLLVKGGANIEARDRDDRTPLYQAAYHRHESIVDLLIDSGAWTEHEYRIIVRGGPKSGKSSIIKQMLVLCGHGYRLSLQDRKIIHAKLLHAAQAVIVSMRDLNIKPIDPRNQEYSDFLHLYALDHDPDAPLDPKVGDAMFSLWKDKSVNQLRGHQKEVDLPDSTSYLFDEAIRIASPGYLPTEADWLRLIKTTSIPGTTLRIDNMQFVLFRPVEAGSVWSFSILSSVNIFCTALSDYDQVSQKNENQNRLEESLESFNSIITAIQSLEKTILLFLTKFDLLGEKLLYSPFKNYFPDYTGGNDAGSVTQYILEQFEKVNQGRLHIHPHMVEATETTEFRNVFPAIKRDILKSYLAKKFRWYGEPYIV